MFGIPVYPPHLLGLTGSVPSPVPGSTLGIAGPTQKAFYWAVHGSIPLVC